MKKKKHIFKENFIAFKMKRLLKFNPEVSGQSFFFNIKKIKNTKFLILNARIQS